MKQSLKKSDNQIRSIFDKIIATIIFDEEKHTYTNTMTGDTIVSVSHFIKPWNQAFVNKMNPEHPDYDKWLHKSMPFFQHRGTNIHKLSEDTDNGYNGPWPYDLKKYEQYYKLFKRLFVDSGKWEIIGIEEMLYSPTLNVCGTIDRLYRDTKTGDIILLDIKSGGLQDINYYQQTVYKMILKEMGIDVDKCYLLSLKKGADLKEIPERIINEKWSEIQAYINKPNNEE